MIDVSYMAQRHDIHNAADADWAEAARREAVIRPLVDRERVRSTDVEAAAKTLSLSRAMIYRLFARYRANPHTSSLLNNSPGRKIGSRILSKRVEQIIARSIKTYFLTPERPPVAALHRLVAGECRKADLDAPCYSSLQSRVDAFDPREVSLKRVGPEATRNRYRPFHRRAFGQRSHCNVVQIDHTLIDVVVVDELDRFPIGRPWLTLVIDVATRMIAGFHLSFDHPCAASVARAIAHAVLPKGRYLRDIGIEGEWPVAGLPEVIHLDNAKEFHSRALERGCREHGIQLQYRQPLRPNYGGHVERLIGTLMGAVHLLPGTTFGSVKERGEYDSEERAAMTVRELELWLTLQITGVYHFTYHRGLAGKPIDVWRGKSDRSQQARYPEDAERFYLDFLPFEQRLLRRDGIQLFRIHYWDNVLSPLAGRSDQPYIVRYDPRDLSRVFVKGRGIDGYLAVPYRDLARPPITLMEHRAASKELAANKRLAMTEDNVFSDNKCAAGLDCRGSAQNHYCSSQR